VVRLCREFESAWRAGQRPALETYLGALSGHDRSVLLRELLRIELQFRALAKESPSVTEYRSRFPADIQAIEAAFRAAPTMDGRPALGLASTTLGGAQRPDFDEFSRPEIPGYLILESLPPGGMGIVYRARQLEPDRMVALKMIRSGVHAGSQELARFRLEAEAIASLSHPHVIKLHDWGEWNGMPYFAMEFAEQGSLADQLASGPLAPEQAALMLEQVALATQFTHEQGIIHRDLKPANILLTAERIPKLADFGLAKRLDQDQGLTQTQAVLGTASYMAPEQAAGKVHALSPAVDIYALGAILYEALTGRPPFRAETREQTIHQVLTEDPRRPSQIRAGVPLALELICLKCLEKLPQDRFATAAELAANLAGFRTGASSCFDGAVLHNRRTRAALRAGFEIQEALQEGSECRVFRARDASLGRVVILELLAVGATVDVELLELLRARATAAANLHHANIVELYSFGELDGEPFLIREFVEGRSIANPGAAAAPLHEQIAMEVEALARAVHHAHQQGIVHGNLKPSKIFRDVKGACKIAGFGAGPTNTALAATLEPAQDLYCLGAILHQLLTGFPPGARQLFEEEFEKAHRGSNLEKELRAICQKCLEPDPNARYVNAAALAEDLRRARAGEVLLIDDLDEWAQQQRWARRAGFKILELLGQGDAGFTYKAVQLSNERLVVLKRISARFRFEPGMKERFRFEARLLNGLRHPNIAAFCDMGEQSDLVYFAREFVEGRSLARLLGTAPERSLAPAKLIGTLARAIQHLHDKRIVHGGLSPDKVHVTPAGMPVITSLARGKVRAATGEIGARDEEAISALRYLAPEQLGGVRRRLERGVDIFALGAILHALVTGKPPVRETSPDPFSKSNGLTAEAVAMDDRSGGDSRLMSICQRCMDLDPAKRFATASRLADELENLFNA
jgi:serine/threonine protein kinase